MFGLGGQEIVVLFFCCGAPIGAAVVAFVAGRRAARKSAESKKDF